MTDAKVGFLWKAASTLQHSENHSLKLLRSYYLMQCKEETKGFGLPEKQFSYKKRCSKCCLEWTSGTEIKVRKLKISKKLRRKIRSGKNNKVNNGKGALELLKSNELEQICTVCKNSTITPVLKPEKIKRTRIEDDKLSIHTKTTKDNAKHKPTPSIKKIEAKKKNKVVKKPEINVYSASKEIFSLSNQSNTIKQKETTKVIKNNKKRKDKFAGLCQKAVLASAKLKEKDVQNKQNKLNLFLKPSSSQ